MDAKTLLDWFTNAPEGSQSFYAIPEAGRATLRSALELAAAVEGGPEATPETDACQGSDGTLRECDELAEKSRDLELQRNAALRALKAERERADAALAWSDEDQWIAEEPLIAAAHPAICGENHDTWQNAMRMVGAKRSKGALVRLVNWLLAERKQANETISAKVRSFGKDAALAAQEGRHD